MPFVLKHYCSCNNRIRDRKATLKVATRLKTWSFAVNAYIAAKITYDLVICTVKEFQPGRWCERIIYTKFSVWYVSKLCLTFGKVEND